MYNEFCITHSQGTFLHLVFHLRHYPGNIMTYQYLLYQILRFYRFPNSMSVEHPSTS